MCIVTGLKIEPPIELIKWLKVCSLKYLGLIGNSFLTKDIEVAIEKGRIPSLQANQAHALRSLLNLALAMDH